MKSSIFASVVLAALTALSTGAIAQRDDKSGSMPEAEMPGNDRAKATAEAKHNAKVHGASTSVKQPEAQMQGSDKPKAAAEAKHNAKTHDTDLLLGERDAEKRESN